MPLGQSGTWALFLECNCAIEHGAILTCWNGLSGRPAGVRLSEAPIDNLLWRCLDKYAPTCAEALNASFLTCHDLWSGGICVKKSLLMPCLVCSPCWTLLVQRPGPPILAKVRMATGFRPLCAEQGRIMLVWQQVEGSYSMLCDCLCMAELVLLACRWRQTQCFLHQCMLEPSLPS